MKIKYLLLIFSILISSQLFAQNMAINNDGSAPDASAALHIKSSSKGFLMPGITSIQRTGITSPADGLQVYDTDTKSFWFYKAGIGWTELASGGSSPWSKSGSYVYLNSSADSVGIGTSTPSAKLHVISTGTTNAGFFSISNTTNSSNALEVSTTGTGKAGLFTISNNTSNANSLEATTNGTGWAVAFFGSALVRGKGNTGSTTAMRVENTSGVNLLKVFDNGNVSIGTPNALNYGGFSSVGTLANKRGLTIASGTSYTANAPAVLELIGSATNVGDEIGMMEFIHEASNGSVYNVARITAVREDASNPTYTGLAFYTRNLANLTEKMRITTLGNVGIGCNDPKYKLHVVGDIAAQGGTIRALSATISTTITACSDIRYKKNIHSLTGVLPTLMQIHGIKYKFKADAFPDKYFPNTEQIGFSAQEVEKYYPEIVVTDKDGYKSIDYTRFAPLLLQAIKEQQSIIVTQEEKMKKMREELDSIKKDIQSLMKLKEKKQS